MLNPFEKIKQVVSAIESPKVFGIAAFLVIAAAIPLTIYVAQKQQEVRQRASEAPPACAVSKTETMLIIDRSGSMNDVSKLAKAKDAAKLFVDKIAQDNISNNVQSRVGLVSFNDYSSLDNGLVGDAIGLNGLKTKIDGLSAVGWTCTECAVKRAGTEIKNNGTSNIKKIVILLTDGRANTVLLSSLGQIPTPSAFPWPTNFQWPTDIPRPTVDPKCPKGICSPIDNSSVSTQTNLTGDSLTESRGAVVGGTHDEQVIPIPGQESLAESIAKKAVKESFDQSGTIFYTIGLGSDVNNSFLTDIATSTGGKYYSAPSADQLNAIYQEIYETIRRGSVSGFVFNDGNGNGQYDTSEQKMTDWKVNLNSGSTITKSAATNSSGDYNIIDICDGAYTLSEEVKDGFVQTAPLNPNYHVISITNGSSYTNKNFGNKIATPTEITPPPPTITPTPTCQVKPPCNDQTTPSCLFPLPPGGWCEDKGTRLELDLKLQSIGTDAAHPNNVVLNSHPVHEERDVVVEVFNSVDNSVQAIVATVSGKVRYDRVSGTFKGTVPIDGIPATGDYAIKVTIDKFLRKLIGRETQRPVFHIVVGQSNAINQTTLIAGDLNGDNKLNIIDYVNYWLPCHNKSKDTKIPDTNKTCEATDLNDDGQVDHDNDENADNINMRDYRWLYNSFQVQEGD